VKVYVVVPGFVVPMVDDHVPVIPLVDVVGSVGAVLFWQRGPICVNVGVTCVPIVISIVAVVAQGSVGVNV